jgi:hypothetical protein
VQRAGEGGGDGGDDEAFASRDRLRAWCRASSTGASWNGVGCERIIIPSFRAARLAYSETKRERKHNAESVNITVK